MAVRVEDLRRIETAEVIRFPVERTRSLSPRRAMRLRRTASVIIVIMAVFGLLLASGPTGSSQAGPKAGKRSVVLQPGETLWEVAARSAPPGVDVRAFVDKLIELNGGSAAVSAGTRIKLPR